MSLPNYSLQRTGATTSPVSFAALGVNSAILRTTTRGNDSLRLTLARDLADAPYFSPFSSWHLLNSAGQIVFTGTVLDQTLTGRSPIAGHFHEVTLAGPRWPLDRLTFLQDGWNFPTDLNQLDGALQPFPHARAILNLSASGQKLSVSQQIEQALDFAISAGANFSFDLTDIPALLPPEDEVTDLTVAEVLDRQLRWLPHCQYYFDYSSAPPLPSPVLRFTTGGPLRNLDPLNSDVSEIEATPRHSLVLSRLELELITPEKRNYQGPQGLPLTRRWLTRATTVSDAPAAPGFGRANFALYLRGASVRTIPDPAGGPGFIEEIILPAESAPSPELAALLHEAYRYLYFDVRLTRVHSSAEPDWSWHPGDRLSLTGLSSGWTDSIARPSMIHLLERDLARATTSIQAGPPTHLGLGDLIALYRANRDRSIPESGGRRQTGQLSGYEAGFAPPAITPEPVRIDGCVDGVPSYYLFPPNLVDGPFPSS